MRRSAVVQTMQRWFQSPDERSIAKVFCAISKGCSRRRLAQQSPPALCPVVLRAALAEHPCRLIAVSRPLARLLQFRLMEKHESNSEHLCKADLFKSSFLNLTRLCACPLPVFFSFCVMTTSFELEPFLGDGCCDGCVPNRECRAKGMCIALDCDLSVTRRQTSTS